MRLAALAALVPLAMLAGVAFGGAALAPDALLNALLHPSSGGDAATIVWQLRVPRVVLAAVVGGALAFAGTLLQALLRNPIVDPYLTGVASGAGASIAIAATLGVAPVLIPPLGFVSGLATAVLVAVLARRGPRLDAERLVLAGISLSALLSAVVALALERLARGTASEAILAWLAGSLAGRGWSDLGAATPEVILGALIGAAAIPALNVLRLGEGRAAALGVDVTRLQWALLVASTLLTAAAVALAGLLGFVGLVVPHLARRVVGPDLRALVPASVLVGAALVVLADAFARTLAAPAEIPLGVLLAFVGVPTFLVLYLRGAAHAYA
ncbi:MAG: iron ABC transporter permease [Candidatus Eremiobacteraeota bacterium]|nr:iron ABC transporter permease [Candidatus Eremiobacteraeota bacterium]MBV8370043.1 iron ABC transporter permease [Candidatus Eremiobacteraeota bacterium]